MYFVAIFEDAQNLLKFDMPILLCEQSPCVCFFFKWGEKSRQTASWKPPSSLPPLSISLCVPKNNVGFGKINTLLNGKGLRWVGVWTLSLQRVTNFKFPRLASPEISHSMENLAFHSLLRWKMIILPVLPTSLICFLNNRLGECTFWS